ncbi:MAG: hypothetical protein AAGB48_02990 [Planctomycetota bacterium]
MRRRTLLPILAASFAFGAAGQGFDSQAVAEGLSTGDTASIQRARSQAVEYLASPTLRVQQRLEADDALRPALGQALASEDEFRTVNALLVMGHLVTPTSLQAVTPYLEDPRPGVKYAAYKAMRTSLNILSQQAAPSLQPNAALDAFGSLVEAVEAQTDPIAIEGGLRAIAAADRVSAQNLRQLEEAARRALPTVASLHAERLESQDDPEDYRVLIGAMLYAMLELRIAINAPDARFSDEALTSAASLGGAVLSHAYTAYEAAGGISSIDDDRRELLGQAIAASETLVYFALRGLGTDAQPTGLAATFQSEDDRGFRAGILRIIGPTGILQRNGIQVAGG